MDKLKNEKITSALSDDRFIPSDKLVSFRINEFVGAYLIKDYYEIDYIKNYNKCIEVLKYYHRMSGPNGRASRLLRELWELDGWPQEKIRNRR